MGKQKNRGFVMHGFSFQCLQCCCYSCTKRLCPYQRGWRDNIYKYRCASCVASNGEMSKCIECDYFENVHTSSRHFKIKRKWVREDEVLKRLDTILQKLDNLKGGD